MNPLLKGIFYCLSIILLCWIVWLFAGCGSNDKGHPFVKGTWHYTPDGHTVLIPRSSSVEETVLELWLDMRVNEWVNSHPDMNPDYLRKKAREINFILVDAQIFLMGGTLSYGMFDCYHTIYACIYPPNGMIQEGEIGLPVIGHELDHVIGVNRGEKGC